MRKIKILFIIFVFLAAICFFWKDLNDLYFRIAVRLPQIENGLTGFFIEKIEKQVVTPEPLRSTEDSRRSFLTRAGIIAWTNKEREKNGLPPLMENPKLNLSAELKVQDMFSNQYFAHNSPEGKGVADFIEKTGPVVQLVRTPACHAGGREFESRPDRFEAQSLTSGWAFLFLIAAG